MLLLCVAWPAVGCTEAPAQRRLPQQTGGTGGSTANLAGSGGSAGSPNFHNPEGNLVFPTYDAEVCFQDDCLDTRVPDDDGFTVDEGDCDDYAPLVNPGAYDVPNNGIDEDCDGTDAQDESCDDALAIGSLDPLEAARALELCARTTLPERSWGVISARWTLPDGMGIASYPLAHGLLPAFGPAFTPRAGQRLLAVSSGVARAPGQPDYTADCSDGQPELSSFPSGFDGTSPSCPNIVADWITDSIALEIQLRVPSNVSALSFDSAFFTAEYPQYICSQFNDFFQVIVSPARAFASGSGNVVFDLDGNSVSVNNSLLRACGAGTHGGKAFMCPLGLSPLEGTGFLDCGGSEVFPPAGPDGGVPGGDEPPTWVPNGASTGWLTTELPVTPGEILTLRIAIWDSGDSALDSLAVVDHIRFRMSDAPPPSEKPVTKPMLE